MKIVIKRDGRRKEFNSKFIDIAISKAEEEVKGISSDLGIRVASLIEDYLDENSIEEISIEQIQDLVVEYLNQEDKDVAKAYNDYREKRTKVREANASLLNDIEDILNQTSEEIRNNANKAGDKLQTYRAMVADVACNKYADLKIIPERLLKKHKKTIYIHDKSYLPIPIFNCININWQDMLDNGFKMVAKIESPKSLQTAIALLTQIVAHSSSNTYGGNTLADLDIGLEKYAIKSYKKHLEVAKKWIKDETKQKEYAWDRLEKECMDSMQSLEYEIATLMNSRGESPFLTVTIGYGRGKYARLIQKCLLETRIKGYSDGTTPVFPKICFFVEDGLNRNPQDENYDMYQLAIKCSTIRQYPDYINVEQLVKVTGDRKSPMGCVEGNEIITYKYKDKLFVESFKRMWERFSKIFKVKEQNIKGNFYIDLQNVLIYDTINGFVDCKRIIKNNSRDWLKIKMTNGRIITCTSNHPFPTQRGRIMAKDLKMKDELHINTKQYSENKIKQDKDYAWFLGLFLCDGCYDEQFSCSLGRDEQELVDKYIKTIHKIFGLSCDKINWWEKEENRNYTEIRVRNYNGINKDFINIFGGKIKNDRQIPNEVFSWDYEAKLSFLAGMIDADGYVNSTKKLSVIQLGSTNKELALQQMALMQSLGMKAKIYENHYTKDKTKIRYRVECVPTTELINNLCCNKKKNNFKTNIRTYSNLHDLDVSYIKEIIKLDKEDYSYDVTTSSDYFEVSGIHSHNCRSFLGSYKDKNGNFIINGRFNQGVCSINLVRLAIMSEHNEDKFFKLLQEALEDTKEVLMIRHNMLRKVKAKQAPILYCEGAVARLNPEDSIEPLLYNGYSSISVGYVGLHNCLMALYGKGLDSFDEDIIKKGQKIMQYLRDYCDTQKKETNIGFSLYSTPAETLATKFCVEDVKDFGVIKGVNDKGYYENSFHFPSDTTVNAIDKINIESNFMSIANGGAIEYTEYGNMIHNEKAIEDIITYTKDKLHYVGVNTRADHCLKCGYKGIMKPQHEGENDYVCPQCGNTDKNTMSIVVRLCGYLGSLSERPTIEGKMKEMQNRFIHVGEVNYEVSKDN